MIILRRKAGVRDPGLFGSSGYDDGKHVCRWNGLPDEAAKIQEEESAGAQVNINMTR